MTHRIVFAALLVAEGNTPQFVRFLITGAVAALVNIGSRWLLSVILGYETPVLVSFLIAMTLAFVLARFFVFRWEGGGMRAAYIRFGLVNLAALAQVWLVSVGLLRFVFPAMNFEAHAETVAHVCGVVTPIFTSYFGHKYFSFRTRVLRLPNDGLGRSMDSRWR